ncbi:MAG: DUF3037 domain-containing protein [Solirubrobacteraceae bacterium]
MPGAEGFAYAVLRIVPSVERGERLNVGVVLYCRRRGFLAARVHLDEDRLRAVSPDCDPAAVRPALDSIVAVAAGDGDTPLSRLDQSDRFGWIAAPSSTIVQPSPVHTGLTTDPQADLDRLFARLVG